MFAYSEEAMNADEFRQEYGDAHDKTFIKPYQEGAEAFNAGCADCPYPKGSKEYERFNKGWLDAAHSINPS